MDPIYFIIGIIAVVLWFLSKTDPEKRKIDKALEKLPGPRRLPIFGSNLTLLWATKAEIMAILTRRFKKYGSPYITWMGSHPRVNLNTPEHVELILNNSVHITKGHFYKLLEPWLQKGLLTSTGEYWHRNRKLLTPSFHFNILNQFVEVFDEKSRKLVAKLREKANGQIFNLDPILTLCALDIICETAMGVSINAMDRPNSEYVSAVYGISKITTDRQFIPWYYNDFIFYCSSMGKLYKKYLKSLHNFTGKVIRERKSQLSNKNLENDSQKNDELLGKKKRRAFLDMLLELSKGGTVITDQEIQQEVDTFMFEGHDTTSGAVCWTLFLLGNHPEIQEKAFQEQQEIFNGEDRQITMKDLGDMKYLERIIKETLRLYPSVPFVNRLLSEEVEIDGVKIPKNVSVAIEIFHVHHNPRVHLSPEKFDPDRFLPENLKQKHPYSYIPFSAGPRNCIGQKFAILEEKTLLSAVIRNFKVQSVEKQEDIKLISELILKSVNGTKLKLESRF